MNYILNMQGRVTELKAKVARLEQGLEDIKQYVCSPKFNVPGDLQGYVNTNDVYQRILSIQYGQNDTE